MWLLGDNPFDPEDRPDDHAALAERLGTTPSRLRTVRYSKGFRDFHNEHTANLGEIVSRRQTLLDDLYERARGGSVEAAKAYLTHTKRAEDLAKAGQHDPRDMSPQEAATLSDEELDVLSGQIAPPT